MMRSVYRYLAAIAVLTGHAVVGQDGEKRPSTSHHYFSKQEHNHHAEWSYKGKTGPDHWWQLSPEYRIAHDGKRQSPIDIQIEGAVEKDLPPLKFDYNRERLTVFNNGHTIQHDDVPGSYLHVGDQVYALEQFHVHVPSEHTINGRHADLELHFVHRSKSGEVAVVAVLGYSGDRTPIVIPPLHARIAAGQPAIRRPFDGYRNPVDLLPTDHHYVTYSGSFTTPPCTEGVRWIVMTTPVQASKQAIAAVQKAVGPNNRPVQKLFGRNVFATR